jgi:hypothetical protein
LVGHRFAGVFGTALAEERSDGKEQTPHCDVSQNFKWTLVGNRLAKVFETALSEESRDGKEQTLLSFQALHSSSALDARDCIKSLDLEPMEMSTTEDTVSSGECTDAESMDLLEDMSSERPRSRSSSAAGCVEGVVTLKDCSDVIVRFRPSLREFLDLGLPPMMPRRVAFERHWSLDTERVLDIWPLAEDWLEATWPRSKFPKVTSMQMHLWLDSPCGADEKLELSRDDKTLLRDVDEKFVKVTGRKEAFLFVCAALTLE